MKAVVGSDIAMALRILDRQMERREVPHVVTIYPIAPAPADFPIYLIDQKDRRKPGWNANGKRRARTYKRP